MGHQRADGPCLTFDGTGLVWAGDFADLELTGDLTLAASINPTNFSGYRQPLCPRRRERPGSIRPVSQYRGREAHPGPWATAPPIRGSGASTGPAAGTWSHLAVTVSGTAVTFYLNGASIGGGGAITVARADTGQPLRMGLRAEDFTTWVGSMADGRPFGVGS